jgi:hypothetical protein
MRSSRPAGEGAAALRRQFDCGIGNYFTVIAGLDPLLSGFCETVAMAAADSQGVKNVVDLTQDFSWRLSTARAAGRRRQAEGVRFYGVLRRFAYRQPFAFWIRSI